MVDARHFSLDFLPGGAASWSVTDSCGSLLVVMDIKGRPFPGHIVCEPLTQRYVRIPQPMDSNNISYWWGPYLLDGEANEVGGRISMSNFRVLCIFDCNRITHTAIFTAGSSWIHTNIDRIAPILEGRRAWALGRAAGCCYFYDERRSMTLVHLDGSTGEFSSSVLPATEDWSSHLWRYNCSITEGCDSKPRIIVVFDDTMKVFSRPDSTEWALEKEIQLTETTCCSLPWYRHDQEISHSHNIVTVGVGFVILSQFQDFGEVQLFFVNLETMEASQAPPAAKNMGWRVYQCKLPWPPALHSCLY
ncbi:hypothetical protein BAE44_0008806 [Dichanthelium oligosanthes]|uniref:DUF1618 domain-containing protein n=1 Tax=Dichanthelium oligosanthes TaxID=888268 RepID=A0A1E5VYI6_9POAL|nr:hypothetical protein BAE44_0008806 [Dichanthelium oligosanthes]